MRNLLSAFATAVLSATLCFSALAQDHVVRDVDIVVTLSHDGAAHVRETWDLSVNKGTEWYLTKYNLGDIRISNLSVSENGQPFIYEGQWNLDRDLEQKAGRCGLAPRTDKGGCEICWGLGSYGDHRFVVDYDMTNVVKSLDDYDCLHVQFVSQGINPYPQHARVVVCADSLRLDEANSAIWAFGFAGTCGFAEGGIVAATEQAFASDLESVILLARFDKGMFAPSSVQSGKFQAKLDTAFENSDYKSFIEQERRRNQGILAVFTAVVLFLGGLAFTSIRKRNKNMFGVMKISDIGYRREIPFNGNLLASRYVLSKCGKLNSEANFSSALILKMIKDGILSVSNDADGKVLICFAQNPQLEGLSSQEREFYDMLLEASGEDRILQEKEFSRWSSRMNNSRRVGRWVEGLTGDGAQFLQNNSFVQSREFTPEGKKQACNVIGFKNFLNDFTLSNERKSAEVALWQDYLIFASLYGIAKKVAREMKDIDPKAFRESFGYDYAAMNRVILISNNMGNTVTNSVARVQTRSSVSGRGGSASFGGGGGFSGGGFGGGAR